MEEAQIPETRPNIHTSALPSSPPFSNIKASFCQLRPGLLPPKAAKEQRGSRRQRVQEVSHRPQPSLGPLPGPSPPNTCPQGRAAGSFQTRRDLSCVCALAHAVSSTWHTLSSSFGAQLRLQSTGKPSLSLGGSPCIPHPPPSQLFSCCPWGCQWA